MSKQSTDIPDGDLVRLARDGDPAAFRLLVERHLPMARARAARLCPQPDDADDAVQDAFLQAFLTLDRLRDPGRFAGWLGGILVNVCHAQRRLAPLTLLGDWPENLHPASAHGLPSAEDLDRADVLGRAIDAVADGGRPRLLMSPRGRPLNQVWVRELARNPGVIAICGRFEGVDERVITARGLIEVSIGDYVLAGGELAAMVLIDACVRLIPGVMGKAASGEDESFSANLIEYPQFTRPQIWEGLSIPEVLTSGDHGKVEAWRRAEAERLTRERRPDLWVAYHSTLPERSSKKGSPKR